MPPPPKASLQQADAANRPTPERQAANSVVAAILLSTTGGYLDAFLYVTHGKVFAGAMTGNAVTLGIALLAGQSQEILHHALPLLAFVCGVWLAELLQDHVHPHGVSVGLLAELLALLAASFLPGSFPDHLYVFLLCLFAAFQIASFRKAGPFSYNSTFITGDLRSVVVGFYEALKPEKRTRALRQGRDMGLLFLFFLAGATGGGLLGHRWANHALWVPVGILALVLALSVHAALTPWPPNETTGL